MNTAMNRYVYAPDHAAPPGDLILEYLEQLGISARELARRCGRSGKLLAEITSGKASVEPETALQLERVLGVPASIWTNMEAAYQLHQAREAENEELSSFRDWAHAFPVKELVERKCITHYSSSSAQVGELLRFFGAGSVKACDDRFKELLAVDFRTSDSFQNNLPALAAWLRIGEHRAAQISTDEYDREAFVNALKKIRGLTVNPIEKALPKIERECAAAGVAFILEKPFKKIRASGVSRWLSPRKALIQQSLRHMSDDHFWFTFFHECAHLLLHTRKTVFIDMTKGPGTGDPKQEAEANIWAADFLVPSAEMRKFVARFAGSADEVRKFAAKCGIAPGIVVGQLQHNRVIGFDSPLNKLRTFYRWVG
jgi:HTH-type transcriptional regulator / antitoxin HigA